MDKPYKLISMEDIRFKLCNIKTLNLIPSVLANQRAVEQGCDEAVLHRGSRITECAHSNISILKDGVLQTAPTDELILPGITRKHLLALAKEHGISVLEKPFSMVELMNADEVIVTSSSALCMKAESIDGIPVGGKDPQRLKLLQDAYLEKFQRETQPSNPVLWPAHSAPGLFVDRGAKVGTIRKKSPAGAGRKGRENREAGATPARDRRRKGEGRSSALQCLREGGAGRGTQAGRPAH